METGVKMDGFMEGKIKGKKETKCGSQEIE